MKFNLLNKTPKVFNHAGAEAYRETPEMELYSAVVTSVLSDSYYEKETSRIKRIRELIAKCDPVFVAKLAVYARKEMYLRTIPLVLTVELAMVHRGDDLISRMVKSVVLRADEITELLAYYGMANQRHGFKKLNRLSKQIQKGLAEVFNSFDEYQFAKYNRDGMVKMRDALFIVHPKAKSESQQALFDKLASDVLQTPYTWETELSALGQVKFETEKEKEKAFRLKWEELIDSGKLGYMALLRNLRNLLDVNVSANHIAKVCETLSDAKAVANAKQLPFRFLSAHREIKSIKSGNASAILSALEEAVVASVQNLKGFDYNTSVIVACDVSGSMQKPISAKSKVMLYDIGLMLGMLLQSKCKRVASGMFGDRWKIINMSSKGVLKNVDEFYRREGEVGYSTNGYLVIDDLISRREVVDKVMMFTDLQLWNSGGGNATIKNSWTAYKKIAPHARLYLFDLAGYGKTPVSIERNDVFLIAGWSDKVFDILDAIEKGGDAIDKIKKMEI